jgi:hypothetical protein
VGTTEGRNGRRARSDAEARRAELEAGLRSFEYDPWTFEDEIEPFGRSARGSRRSRRSVRLVAAVVALAIVLPVLISVVTLLVHAYR